MKLATLAWVRIGHFRVLLCVCFKTTLSAKPFIRISGFALRLALKQKHNGTRKWPIESILLKFPFDNLILMNGFAVGKVLWLTCQ